MCHSEDTNISLTKKGREVQQSMGIQTQILQKMKIEGNDAENMVNDMLSKLGDL